MTWYLSISIGRYVLTCEHGAFSEWSNELESHGGGMSGATSTFATLDWLTRIAAIVTPRHDVDVYV